MTDQEIAFTVSAVTCGIPSIGTDGFETAAQGQCEVDLSVANLSSDAASFSSSMVTGYIGTNEYSAEASASIGEESSLLFEEINPGNSIAGKVYIDIPAGSTPDRVQIYDGAFGAAVEFTVD